MTNKRNLKKTINYICSDLFAESVAASLYGNNPPKENVNALMTSILSMHSDFIQRISHPEPGMSTKKYYKILSEDFNKKVSELVDQICNLN